MSSNNVSDYVLQELVKVMRMPGSNRDQFATCDLVDQDNLFAIQEQLAKLALVFAGQCDRSEWLAEQFPALYSVTKGAE